jgi:hypothetical protein
MSIESFDQAQRQINLLRSDLDATQILLGHAINLIGILTEKIFPEPVEKA